jgi:hypothetical protein
LSKKKQGEGRGLDAYEVAVIKRMVENHYPRDEIMSFFIWPGRKISPAAVSEIVNGRIGSDIEPATNEAAQRFIRRRLSDANPFSSRDYVGGPTSEMVVREILRTAGEAQRSFPGFESNSNEFKQDLPSGRTENSKIAKAMASFANAQGGYIFFGIDDNRKVKGLSGSKKPSKAWTELSQIVASCFTPAITWQQNIVVLGSVEIGVIHIPESLNKPIIATRDCEGIVKGTIYYRYNGLSMPIEPGDLLNLLAQRDRVLIAAHLPGSTKLA